MMIQDFHIPAVGGCILAQKMILIVFIKVSTGGSIWRCSAETICLSMLFFGLNICQQKHTIKQQYRLALYARIRHFKFSFLSSSCVPGMSLLSQILHYLEGKTNHT